MKGGIDMNIFKSYFLFKAPYRSVYFLFFLSILLILSSCAKTRTPLTQSNRSNIKKIAILVEADEEFNVSIEKYRTNIWGESFSGGIFDLVLLIPAIIVEIDKDYSDKKHEEVLESKLVQFSPDEIMSDRLKHYLVSSDAGFTAEVTEVKSPDVLKANGFDTILEVNLTGFEVEPCFVLVQEEYLNEEHSRLSKQLENLERKLVQVGGGDKRYLYSKDSINPNKDVQEILEEMEAVKLKIHPLAQEYHYRKYGSFKPSSHPPVNVRIKLSGRMILLDDNTAIWEPEEFYKDENCYPLVGLKTQPELLVDMITRAIDNLAQNTVNEIVSSNEPAD